MDIVKLFSYLTSSELQRSLLPWKVTLIIFALFFLGGVIYFLIRTNYLKVIFWQDAIEIFTYRPYGVRKIIKTWRKITGRLESGVESEYKLAVIEADAVLDDTLKRIGYKGEDLEERLKELTSATLPNIDQVREAHQVRNSAVREPDFRLSLDQTKRVIEIYEQALRDLQAF